MATSSAVPAVLRRTAEAHQEWAVDLARWAARLASSSFVDASLIAAAQRTGTLSGRAAGHAGWTRGIVAGFEAADRRLAAAHRPDVWLAPLPMTDVAARIALLRAMVASGEGARTEALAWLMANRGGRYLRVDPSGDGRVVEVLGNLATAKHVVFVVPGMSNDIGNYRSSLRRKAASLLAAMRTETHDSVAVVSWLGYDTPGLAGASRSGAAKVAAVQLIADVAAIRNSYPAAHVTVVAHSYGSVVLGQAMKAGLDAPTAVAVGSPGMDADDRSELGSRGTTLWAAKSTTALAVHVVPFFGVPWFEIRIGDPVAFAPVHGEDPAAKGFGSRRFPVGDISGHGEYFDPGSVSVRNIARIAISRRPE